MGSGISLRNQLYQSYQVLFTNVLVFEISFSLHPSVSSVDTLHGLKSFSIFKILFQTFRIPFFMYHLSILSQYISSYSFDVSNDSSLYIMEKYAKDLLYFTIKVLKNVVFKVIQVILSDL